MKIMNNSRCLYCLQKLEGGTSGDYHPACSRTFFGSIHPPELPYSFSELQDLAKQVVGKSIAVTGVQPKLSLSFEKNIKEGEYRLTLVGLWGNFILKPPNAQYPEIVEIEHATMRMAQNTGIETVPYALIRLKSGELAYITRRVDRIKQQKLAMEDCCQLSGRLTEYKYRGSVEQLAKTIRQYSSNPGLDVNRFFEIVLFSFLTGNADMHQKNYSILTEQDGAIRLAPAYDLLATALLIPDDNEESALTINGKKSNLKLGDFQAFAEKSGIPMRAYENTVNKFQQKMPEALRNLSTHFISISTLENLTDLVNDRMARLFNA
jgi:serine/threonine-protein kinase HipA